MSSQGIDGALCVQHTEAGPECAIAPTTARSGRFRGSHPGALVAVLVVLLAVPMVVALIALLHARWYPLLDMAWTEMRVRDVWSSHPPLLGLAGRIGPAGHSGSHPGPLSFYALWPVYELFGATSWALEASSVALQVAAISVSLWIVSRRGGRWLVLGHATVLAILLRGYGATLLTQPWNPYLPVLWWLVFLLAVWSVLCDDLALLPLAVLAGSFCAQTEVAYLGLTLGLGAIAIGIASARAYSHRADRQAVRRFALWVLVSFALAVLIWLPPVVEQLTTARGNLSLLFTYLTHPPQSPVGLGQGLRLMLAHLNPVYPLSAPLVPTSNIVRIGLAWPGALLLSAWAWAASAAWRARLQPLAQLHALLAVILVLGVLSISRIFGPLWYYLLLWGWGVGALMVVATGWTLSVFVNRRLQGATRRHVQLGIGFGLVAIIAGITALFTIEASSTQNPMPFLADELRAVVNPTVRGLERYVGSSHARSGVYLVTFSDPASLGSQAFGLMNELERRGFDVGATGAYRNTMTPHRVVDPTRATAVVHVAVGSDISTWRAKQAATELAYSDPRSPRQRTEFNRLRSEVIIELQAAGRSYEASHVDQDLIGLAFERVPEKIHLLLGRMDSLGLPIAVFLAPPTVQ
jgi:hypothetical protein